jgi:hypothetical protein
MRRALPLVLALAAALPVALLTATADSRYEATASTRLQILFGDDQVSGLRSFAGLPQVTAPTTSPLLPFGAASLARIEARTAGRVSGASSGSEDVRVIDTAAELGVTKFSDAGVRLLKAKAVADDPDQAARLANVYLSEYIRERSRSIHRLLSEAGARFEAGATPSLERITPASRRELLDAIDIAGSLDGGVLTYHLVPATPPDRRISPKPVRDTIVAALIGALLGWLVGQLRVPASSSNSSRLRATIASWL